MCVCVCVCACACVCVCMYVCMYVERSGSVVECLTRDRVPRVRASQASLRCVLELDHLIFA